MTGKKEKSKDIELQIECDGIVVGSGTITDSNITDTSTSYTLGTRPIGIDTLTGSSSDSDIDLYSFVARIPLYATGNWINFSLSSTNGVWILEKARLGVNKEPLDVFSASNYV